jgi:hypothetical protein
MVETSFGHRYFFRFFFPPRELEMAAALDFE